MLNLYIDRIVVLVKLWYGSNCYFRLIGGLTWLIFISNNVCASYKTFSNLLIRLEFSAKKFSSNFNKSKIVQSILEHTFMNPWIHLLIH